ncbi:hypothetical protein BJ138DRAFT_1120868 [Hygrophoropsis aurantiaca]|uniref:Uncharacterized protein n=1 Tax=Hygrophoropsis aurantiaca TaxID=72124 RepID=A0ACB7ZPG9_9AGAM|nr:hypothetical protein BJ138DRAFT_1120868 [Hygrophoropsis aurantiaca]
MFPPTTELQMCIANLLPYRDSSQICVRGAFFGTELVEPMSVNIPLNPDGSLNTSYWLHLNGNNSDIRRVDFANLPKCNYFRLPATYSIYYLNPQTSEHYNLSVGLCTEQYETDVKGDLLVVKHFHNLDKAMNMNARDFNLVCAIVGA